MGVTSGDRDNARQISWYIALPVEVHAPCYDGTVGLEGKVVETACSDRDDVCQIRGGDKLPLCVIPSTDNLIAIE